MTPILLERRINYVKQQIEELKKTGPTEVKDKTQYLKLHENLFDLQYDCAITFHENKKFHEYKKYLIQSLNTLNRLLILYPTFQRKIPIRIHQSYFLTCYELFELTRDPEYLKKIQTHIHQFFPPNILSQIEDQNARSAIKSYYLYTHEQLNKLKRVSIVDDVVVRPSFSRIHKLLSSSNNSASQTPASESRSSENLKQHGTENTQRKTLEKKREKALVTYSVVNAFHNYENNDDDPPPIRLKRHKVG